MVSIDAPKIRRVREACKVDLADRQARQFEQLTGDPLLAGEVLWELCRSQAEAVGIAPDAFQSLLSGDDGEQAGHALIEAIIDFFPTRQRSLLREMLATENELADARHQAVQARLSDAAMKEKRKAAAIADINAKLDQLLMS
jgi:hypothetical protein